MGILAVLVGSVDPYTASLDNHTISDTTGGADARATLRLTQFGALEFRVGTVGDFSEQDDEWLVPRATTDVTAQFEARMTTNSGALTDGVAGSWLSLDTLREWFVQQEGPGTSAYNGTLEIRRNGLVVTSCTIILSAEVTI